MIFDNYKRYLEFIEKKKVELRGEYGSILTMEGYVRNYHVKDGKKIPAEKMVINKEVIDKIKDIPQIAKEKYNLLEVVIFHNYGELKVGERITSITIFSRHRYEAFEAIKYIIDEIKKFH
ncbi:molybdenum cofactor biosynthesis protein MoaE [Methanocaldococcus indicus]|uniref:molybdenum cofactor biosynthesis protein MoaE n=1 Tax=Methanocaldococcus indicus TaxID=213231 RepID=UPI003C6D24DA